MRLTDDHYTISILHRWLVDTAIAVFFAFPRGCVCVYVPIQCVYVPIQCVYIACLRIYMCL